MAPGSALRPRGSDGWPPPMASRRWRPSDAVAHEQLFIDGRAGSAHAGGGRRVDADLDLLAAARDGPGAAGVLVGWAVVRSALVAAGGQLLVVPGHQCRRRDRRARKDTGVRRVGLAAAGLGVFIRADLPDQ